MCICDEKCSHLNTSCKSEEKEKEKGKDKEEEERKKKKFSMSIFNHPVTSPIFNPILDIKIL